MRYYKIVITDPVPASPLGVPASTTPKVFRTYTSLRADGTTDVGALDIELDAPVTTFANPMGDTGAAIKIWGVSLEDRAASADFNGKTLQFFGGMAKGLPLAHPEQQGLLFQGKIYQAWGNSVGVNQTLDLLVIADTGTTSSPANVVLNWQAGQNLSQAIENVLSTAFPGVTSSINISPNLILGYDVPGVYDTMAQFARYVKRASRAVINGPNGGVYPGVDILLRNGQFLVYDGTTQKTPKALSFLDLIGQPTFINPFQVQAMFVMRADIEVGDYVTLPPGLVTTAPQGQAYFKDKTTFQGTFKVLLARHVGHFRQPDAAAWVSVYDLAKETQNA